jgi:hypothetical protein
VIPAPDGYQYGVRFNDGAVTARWNGSTQRQRAEAEAERLAVEYAPDNIVAVRRRPGSEWETYA